MKMEHTECSETSAYKIQTPGNYQEENIQRTEHGESLKSRIDLLSYLRIQLDILGSYPEVSRQRLKVCFASPCYMHYSSSFTLILSLGSVLS